jgi:hypothetical protein
MMTMAMPPSAPPAPLTLLALVAGPAWQVRKQVVMREGEAGAEMYMLMSGEVEVLVGLGTKHQR